MTDVRELLELAAEDVAGEPPVARIVAAGRRRVRRRAAAVTGGGVAAAAVLAGVLAGVPALPAPTSAPTGALSSVTGASCPALDRSRLPGRPVGAADGFPTADAADLLRLHGWPRAVPYEVVRWTAITDGDRGVLIAWKDDRPSRYVAVTRTGRTWTTSGLPCTP